MSQFRGICIGPKKKGKMRKTTGKMVSLNEGGKGEQGWDAWATMGSQKKKEICEMGYLPRFLLHEKSSEKKKAAGDWNLKEDVTPVRGQASKGNCFEGSFPCSGTEKEGFSLRD